METQEYNGWTNRETWATMLHIDNDMFLLDTALDYAQQQLEEAESEDRATRYLAESVQSWLENDLLTRENVAGNEGLWLMLTDIGSLYRVNWQEIAETLVGYVKERQGANV
jgi:hypothetical protein